MRRVSPHLIGRAAELDTASEHLARAGEPTAILIGGEAGDEQSHLAAAISARAAADGWKILTGVCVSPPAARAPSTLCSVPSAD